LTRRRTVSNMDSPNIIGAKGSAHKLLNECGVEIPLGEDLRRLVAYKGGILIEKPLPNGDGRIIHGKNHSIIRINSNIEHTGRKRFTIAHELGHLVMHKEFHVHNDSKSLNWLANTIEQLKFGKEEAEANAFASELLMPSRMFREALTLKKLSPELLSSIADTFQTSIISSAFKCVDLDLYPMCIFFIENGQIKYWNRSRSLALNVNDRVMLAPPQFSVAMEYLKAGYKPIYNKSELQQRIDWNVWFSSSHVPEYSSCFEYCIPIQQANTMISIVWQD
jgi:Zn-dependent peptidase ImmA (M78 family)